MGLEIMVVLMFCNLLYPHSVVILRGNHETRTMTEKYGFKQEVEAKYSLKLYEDFMKYFDALPLAAIVDDTVFVTHGGIDPETQPYHQSTANHRPSFAEIDTEAFLKRNKLSLLIRSHEYKEEGFDQ
eukprot:gene27831-31441_t